MPGTFSQILLHIVFSTKKREPWIVKEIQKPLYRYIGGIVRKEGGVLLQAGGIEDHIHLYLRWRPDSTISNLVRSIKARSSKWIHAGSPDRTQFAWQEGYSVFSVSKSLEYRLKRYIANQQTHHAKESYRSELSRLLRLHEVGLQGGFDIE